MKYKILIILLIIINYLGISFGDNIKSIQNTGFSKIENINIDTIKKEWTKRHNQERLKYSLSWYILDNNLNKTAKTRSDKLANSWTTNNLHQRITKDWYYNYWNIKLRFENLWIGFKDVNWTLFTESIW